MSERPSIDTRTGGEPTAAVYRRGIEHYRLRPARYIDPVEYPEADQTTAAAYMAAIEQYHLHAGTYADTIAYLEERETAPGSSRVSEPMPQDAGARDPTT